MIGVTPFFEFVLVAVGIGSFAILLLAMLAAMRRASSRVSRLAAPGRLEGLKA
jgi:hypothetical protein